MSSTSRPRAATSVATWIRKRKVMSGTLTHHNHVNTQKKNSNEDFKISYHNIFLTSQLVHVFVLLYKFHITVQSLNIIRGKKCQFHRDFNCVFRTNRTMNWFNASFLFTSCLKGINLQESWWLRSWIRWEPTRVPSAACHRECTWPEIPLRACGPSARQPCASSPRRWWSCLYRYWRYHPERDNVWLINNKKSFNQTR